MELESVALLWKGLGFPRLAIVVLDTRFSGALEGVRKDLPELGAERGGPELGEPLGLWFIVRWCVRARKNNTTKIMHINIVKLHSKIYGRKVNQLQDLLIYAYHISIASLRFPLSKRFPIYCSVLHSVVYIHHFSNILKLLNNDCESPI